MSSPNDAVDLYGHERRFAERTLQRKQAIQQSKEICETLWQNFYKKKDPVSVSEDDINQLYSDILEKIQESIQTKFIPFALFERKRFFEQVNKTRRINNLAPFPEPVIASRIQRPKNINDFDNFLYLTQAQRVVNDAIIKWRQKNSFLLLDCISWFLFSMVNFAGYNDINTLKAIYEHLADAKPIYQLLEDMLCLPINLISPIYANQIIQVDDETQELYCSRLIIVDDISRLWLLKIQTQRLQEDFPKYHQVIKRLGEFVGESFTVKSIEKSNHLKHISIYWQTLPNVRLDVQLVEVLQGNQKQTAITENHLLRYFQQFKQPKIILVDENIEKLIIEASTESPQGVRQIDVYKSDIVKDIRRILNADKKTVKAGLIHLLSAPLFPNQKRLVQWMVDLHIDGNKISTLKRYLSDIGNDFVAGTRDTDFLGWTKHNYHFVYDDIVANKNQNRTGFTTTVICSLHNSLKKHYYAPAIDLSGGGDPQIVSSYLIPNHVYQQLQQCVVAQEGLSNYNKQLVSIVLTLLYRSGMRISEILGLQVKDVEYDNQSFNEYNMIVRSNAHRSLKSDDGTRRLNLSVLLPSNELVQFKAFFDLKRAQGSQYLFTLQYHASPLSRHSIEQPIKKILADTIYRDITLHAFRHNAISNMAVILRCDYSIVKYFTDYQEVQLTDIKQHYLGKIRKVSTNFWDALMEFSGHADLNTTFSSYIHTADIIASHQLQQATLTLPLDIVNKLIGTSRDKLYQHDSQAVNARENKVYLGLIRQYLNRKIHTTDFNIVQVSADSKLHGISKNDTPTTKTSTLFGIYSLEKIEKLLQDVEAGQTLGEASSLNFNYDDALLIYERALSLVKNKDGSLNHKLISKERKQKSEHILIAPTPLHYREEKALVHLCFDELEKLYSDKATRQAVKEILSIFYKKVNTSKSEIRFTFKEKKLFYKYLRVMCSILPSVHWQVNMSRIKSKSFINEQNKRVVESFVDKQLKSKIITDFNADHPHFDGKITTTDNYNGYTLSLISPVKNSQNYSSALMKYVLHFLLIVDGLSG